ncbi:hypothetical protein ONZ45_g9789 [Pleurotus djamor]|nr:hypothetical protein ONZ45_g9789 [Pleurotus djamor]
MSRTSQIEDLDIHLPQRQVTELLALSSTQRAPTLQHLKIYTQPGADDGTGAEGACLWSEMPSLLSLEVSYIPLPVEPLFAPRLRHLQVYSSRHIPMAWLLDTLRATPLLETIDVEDLGPEPTGFESPPVSLHHLQKIFANSECFGAVTIFKYLRLPVTCAIEAMYPSANSSETSVNLTGLRETFSRFTSNYLPSSLERISVSLYDTSFALYVYRPGDDYRRYDADGGLPFIYFSPPSHSLAPNSAYIELCHLLPLAHTRILALEGVKGDTVVPLALSLMIASTHADTLELSDCDPGLLTHLFQTSNDDPLVLPKLECLIFKENMFHVDSVTEPDDLLSVLVRLLQERRELGTPIKTLKCWRCEKVPPSDMKRLHRLVDSIEWDD